MTIGEGIAFASIMWMIIHVFHIVEARSRKCTHDDVTRSINNLTEYLKNTLGE